MSGNVAPYGWTELGTTKYVWDGWNLMAELNGTYGPMRTYAWGLDLSGSEQGAGGIGGLVFETDWLFGGGNPGTTFHPFYDGNGNLMSLRDPGGVPAAAYDYGAFGEILTTGGFYAGYNPFRFSTKFADAESGLLYYGYRYLNTSTGRWLSRDPIEEGDGPSLYALVCNTTPNALDLLGHIRIVLCFEGWGGTWGISGSIAKDAWKDLVEDTGSEWKYAAWDQGKEEADKLIKRLQSASQSDADTQCSLYDTIVLIGFSKGGVGAFDAAEQLGKHNIKVDYIFTADPVKGYIVNNSTDQFPAVKNATEVRSFYQRLANLTMLKGHFVVGGGSNQELGREDFNPATKFTRAFPGGMAASHDEVVKHAHEYIPFQDDILNTLEMGIKNVPETRSDWKWDVHK